MYFKQSLIWNKRSKSKVQTSPIDRDEENAWRWFSKYIRLRDCMKMGNKEVFKCVSCGVLTHFTKWDAWHFISRSYKATKFDERNVYAQCISDNRFKSWCWNEMYEHIKKLHWQEVIDELMLKSKEIVRYVDYSAIADFYRKKYNEMLKK